MLKGEDSPNAILTEEAVIYCRAVYTPGHSEHGAYALGRKYGVTYSTIVKAVSHVSWKHVEAVNLVWGGQSGSTTQQKRG